MIAICRRKIRCISRKISRKLQPFPWISPARPAWSALCRFSQKQEDFPPFFYIFQWILYFSRHRRPVPGTQRRAAPHTAWAGASPGTAEPPGQRPDSPGRRMKKTGRAAMGAARPVFPSRPAAESAFRPACAGRFRGNETENAREGGKPLLPAPFQSLPLTPSAAGKRWPEGGRVLLSSQNGSATTAGPAAE